MLSHVLATGCPIGVWISPAPTPANAGSPRAGLSAPGPSSSLTKSFNRGRGDHRLGLYLALVTGTLSTGLGPRGRHCGRHRVASAALLLGSRQSILAGTAR